MLVACVMEPSRVVRRIFLWSETSDEDDSCRQYSLMREGAYGRESYLHIPDDSQLKVGDVLPIR